MEYIREKQCRENCHTAVSDMMKKLYSLLLILTTIKKVNVFQKFMSVSITFVAVNHEEMLKKDFASKYLLEVKAVAIRTKLPFIDLSYIAEAIS